MSEQPRGSFFARGDAWAGFAGLFSVGLAATVRFAVGAAYNNWEARVLLGSLIEGGLYLVSAITGASATVVALMLTVLGLARNADSKFTNALYGQIRWISIIASVTLATSVLTLLLMSVPLSKADNIPRAWTIGLYYTISGAIAMLSGAMISLVIMLLTAVLGIIRSVAPDADVSDSSTTPTQAPQ